MKPSQSIEPAIPVRTRRARHRENTASIRLMYAHTPHDAKLFRNGDKVGEIEGADEARLRALIDQADQNKGASERDEDA